MSITGCAIIYVFISIYQHPPSCSNFCINSQEPSLLLYILEFSAYHPGSRKWGSYEPSCCGWGSSNCAEGGIINRVSTLQLYQVYLFEFCHTSKKTRMTTVHWKFIQYFIILKNGHLSHVEYSSFRFAGKGWRGSTLDVQKIIVSTNEALWRPLTSGDLPSIPCQSLPQ